MSKYSSMVSAAAEELRRQKEQQHRDRAEVGARHVERWQEVVKELQVLSGAIAPFRFWVNHKKRELYLVRPGRIFFWNSGSALLHIRVTPHSFSAMYCDPEPETFFSGGSADALATKIAQHIPQWRQQRYLFSSRDIGNSLGDFKGFSRLY